MAYRKNGDPTGMTCKGCGADVVASATITTEDGEVHDLGDTQVAVKTCDCPDDCALPDLPELGGGGDAVTTSEISTRTTSVPAVPVWGTPDVTTTGPVDTYAAAVAARRPPTYLQLTSYLVVIGGVLSVVVGVVTGDAVRGFVIWPAAMVITWTAKRRRLGPAFMMCGVVAVGLGLRVLT
jgi:hypothetical protein